MVTTEKKRIMTTLQNKVGCKMTGYFPEEGKNSLKIFIENGWKIIKQELET